MKAVWKFPLGFADYTLVDMPRGAVLLFAAMQEDRLCLWALVDTDAPTKPRSFRIAGTGHPIRDEDAPRWVGTVMLHGANLIFHVFEVTP